MKKLPSYEQQNRSAAEIILEDVARHGGLESLMVRWALKVMDRAAEQDHPRLFPKRKAA
jgi:hypothetical protein